MCCVYVLTLVCIVLDFKLQLSGVGLHSVHMALQVLLILLMSIFKLDEFLLRKKHKHTQEDSMSVLCAIKGGFVSNDKKYISFFLYNHKYI